jgi:restriction endonuclease Mrr
MTFTEAAVEILRRAGKPLHFKEIAAEAVTAGILSHVGQTPEATMGARLVSMAKREHDRKITALDGGVFALAEWGVPAPATAVVPPELHPPVDDGAPQYRSRERHPPLQQEVLVGGRRDERRGRRGEEEEDGKRKKRYLPPSEVAAQWLRERGQPATLAELAKGLRENDRIAEALERDLPSLERALKEENRRRLSSRRPPLFEFGEDGSVKWLEPPKEAPRERVQRAEKPRREEQPRPAGAEEQRRNVVRSIRRRLGGLDAAALERVCVAFLEAQGYRELHMARRSAKEGPLYLARHKWGANEFRYAIRILRPGRDLGRSDVQDVRRDLQHYSAQLGMVLGTGECSRDAKGEANAPNQAPTMLFGGEALAESLVDSCLGATKRLIEWFEYDDEFFASMGAGEALPEVEGEQPPSLAVESAESEARTEGPRPEASREERDRRPRDRRRGRRPREGQPEGAEAGGEGPEETTEVTEPESAPPESQPSLPVGAPESLQVFAEPESAVPSREVAPAQAELPLIAAIPEPPRAAPEPVSTPVDARSAEGPPGGAEPLPVSDAGKPPDA